MFGKREYGDIIVEREYISSDGIFPLTIEDQVNLLHTRVYNKNKDPVATLVMIHGLGEHSGRYLGIAKALVDGSDIEVQMIDLRGYGGSGGGRVNATFHQLHFRYWSIEVYLFCFLGCQNGSKHLAKAIF